MINHKLGSFELSFEKSGKLFQLILPGVGPVLHESDYKFDLKDGRVFHPGGWDECFPTIEPHSGWPLMGSLIGEEPEFRERADRVEQVWSLKRFTAERHFLLGTDRKLQINFTATNHSATPIEFLWASHALFSFENLTRVTFPDESSFEDFSLDGSAIKDFVRADGPIQCRKKTVEFSLSTDQPLWGIWFNRGGWPVHDPAGFGCLGIEATNTAADQPANTCLMPGDSFSGCVWVEL